MPQPVEPPTPAPSASSQPSTELPRAPPPVAVSLPAPVPTVPPMPAAAAPPQPTIQPQHPPAPQVGLRSTLPVENESNASYHAMCLPRREFGMFWTDGLEMAHIPCGWSLYVCGSWKLLDLMGSFPFLPPPELGTVLPSSLSAVILWCRSRRHPRHRSSRSIPRHPLHRHAHNTRPVTWILWVRETKHDCEMHLYPPSN